MGKFKDYAQETTIHGFNELFKYKSPVFKIIWSVTLIVMTASFVYEAYKAIDLYVEKPTATVVAYTRSNQFPKVALCTNDWLDPEKVAQMGFETSEELQYLLGPFCPSVDRPTNVGPRADFVFNNTSRPLFREKEKEAGGYIDLLYSLAYDFDQIGQIRCSSCESMKVNHSATIKEEGVCWFFDPGRVIEPTTRMFRNPSLTLDLKLPGTVAGGGLNLQSMFTLFFGNDAVDITGVSQARAVAGMTNIVDISLTDLSRVVKCNGTQGHTMSTCDMQCFTVSENLCECPCYIFAGDHKSLLGHERRSDRVCNFLDPSPEEKCSWDCLKMKKDMCASCKPPCSETSVAVTAFQLNKLPLGADMSIEIRVRNQFKKLLFREFFSYTITSLLSDFGGLSGLFLGASVISIAHAVYFCICLPCHRVSAKKSTASMEN